MNYKDDLLMVNSKNICPSCKCEKPSKKHCRTCGGHGFLPIDLSGLWNNCAGFLVCGGPSINLLPFNKLADRGVVSLAINNVAGHVPVTAWTFSDPQEKFHHGLFLDPKIITFAPIPKLTKKIRIKDGNNFIWSENIRVMDCPNTFGYDRKTLLFPDRFLSEKWAMWGYGGKQEEPKPFICLATVLLGLRLLCYLGLRRIYLLGVDFSRQMDAQYAFNQRANPSNSRYTHENMMLKSVRPILESVGIEVYNCNPESKCDAFDFKSFDDAYNDCRGRISEPFDLSGWYEKEGKK